MKNSIKTLGLALVILLAGSTLLPAQYGMGRGMACPRIPDLTEKQKTDITALADKHQSQMDDLRKEMVESTDIEKRGEIAKKIQILRDTHRKDVLDQLTDAQKETFNAGGTLAPGRRGNGPMNGNFRGRGSRGGMGYGNMNGCFCGRGQGRGMGFGNMNGRR